MKPFLRRLLLALLALMVLTPLAGFVYERMARAKAMRQFPPAGKMVDIGGRRLQLDCRGSGKPTVVFESGLDWNGSLSWAKVHDAVAKKTRACAYSRAGIMWSDADSRVRSGKDIATDLHLLLSKAGEAGPFVLVAHSAGGPYAMHYTKYFGDEVAGLVLVDSSHPDQIERLKGIHPEAIESVKPPELWDRVKVELGIRRLTVPARVNPRPNQPGETIPAIAAHLNTTVIPMFDEFAQLKHTFPEINGFRALGARPLVVLSATETPTGLFPSFEQYKQYVYAWNIMQIHMATWSSRSKLIHVPGASHYIQFDQPQAVIDATQSVLDMLAAKP